MVVVADVLARMMLKFLEEYASDRYELPPQQLAGPLLWRSESVGYR
jgi:hypothetical protein